MTEFNVIDSLMGTGKTSWIIEQMNKADFTDKFIYITPYRAEIERVMESVKERPIKTPDNSNAEGRKLRGLKDLVSSGYDIVSTHQLLRTADDELIELVKENGYKLIIDEAMEVVNEVNINPRDIQRLQANEDISIEENGQVSWTGDDDFDTRFTDIYYLARAGTLYIVRGKMLVKIFSDEVMRSFESVTVMTYLFGYTQMAAWFEMNGFKYEKSAVQFNEQIGEYELVSYDIHNEDREALYSLMDIDEGKYTVQLSHLSYTTTGLNKLPRFSDSLKEFDTIERVVRNFLDANKDGKEKGYWTILKSVKDHIIPRGYARRHISLNLRATNEYADAPALVYLSDRYLNPMQMSFFEDRGVTYNQEGWALSELLQFIYRSRIRNGKKVSLLIPPKRMRLLLQKWSRYEL